MRVLSTRTHNPNSDKACPQTSVADDGHEPHNFARLELVRHLRERHVEPALHRHLLQRQLVQCGVDDAREIGPQPDLSRISAAHGAVEAVVKRILGGVTIVRAVHSVKLGKL
jgi:hypothetical protein